ncbi:MAG: hypothetical protein EAZ85_04625 [Bacteroidetes bacterium]|nr:MAG: hypothetical protein EAZ85_04625 [Bacteroidota bacterium]TAG89972.1 MAG: hypothetical protein EAZ20_05335 [Bacteroidota bacterium]
MMQIIKQEFSDRVDEINRYFQLLENITEKDAQLIFPNESDRRENLNIRLGLTLKSGLILLLYNLVESSISKCLGAIHQSLTDENLSYFQMSDDLQKIWLKYHYELLNDNGNNNDRNISQLQTMVEILSTNKTVIISLDDSKKLSESLYSGNLDAKEIRKIAKKYGVSFELESKEIRFVEQMRNKLAHGEVSFEEGCQDKPIQYMRKVKDETINFINEFTIAVENFITERKYKK